MDRVPAKDSKGGVLKWSGIHRWHERKKARIAKHQLTSFLQLWEDRAHWGRCPNLAWYLQCGVLFETQKSESHRKEAQRGFGWQYLFEVIMPLSLTAYA